MDMARSILSLLKHDPLIKGLLAEKNTVLNRQKLFPIWAFNKLSLLNHLMHLCPLPDLQFEEFLRFNNVEVLFKILEKIEASLNYFFPIFAISSAF